MNEETKEILEGIAKNKYDSAVIYDIDILGLLDYITNLQEENKEFHKRWEKTNVIIRNDKELVMNSNAYSYLRDKEIRIDKAIEYINSGKVKVMKYIDDFNTPIHTNWKLTAILKGDE